MVFSIKDLAKMFDSWEEYFPKAQSNPTLTNNVWVPNYRYVFTLIIGKEIGNYSY